MQERLPVYQSDNICKPTNIQKKNKRQFVEYFFYENFIRIHITQKSLTQLLIHLKLAELRNKQGCRKNTCNGIGNWQTQPNAVDTPKTRKN